ncbi:CocE/NonD family hydrolase [Marinobacter arenosus]|uniref:CocE/NonD family hydrolase n=1 Tax=Marinobacter arenosus TaxID=2856822 RepID=UPI001C4C37C1|nr:CocE/NonD family hydrolase [Marinobacter arenosus]MBW0147163.1 CocE/NonD family hydrolase [Marinobacter arenosus]
MPHSIRFGMRPFRLIPVLLALAVAGCVESSSDGASSPSAQSSAAPGQSCDNPGEGAPPQCQLPPPVSCTDDAPREGGRSYPVMLTSASGETIAFQVLEPIGGIDCTRGHPLVLHGHGFGGSRTTDGFENYRQAGFAVISIDQRGFGESTGTVRVMDPEFEGRDLIQILDWAEGNLDYLQYRNEPDLPAELNPNLVAGAIGGSYGGGYQLLLHGQDPGQRLDALVPDITWYDLRDSLNPGDVIKTGWDLVLVAGGEAGSTGEGNGGLDPIIREILAQGATLNRFPEAGLDFFYYHSPAYRCTGQPVSISDSPDLLNYQINPPAFDVAPTPYSNVDVLLTQGMKDTLFNFNEAWRNFECLSALGGDVRLLTHQTGHILPVEAPDELQPAEYVDPTAELLELPGFQGAAGQFACGSISISDATLNWLEHHLQGKPLAGYFDGTESEVCLSLDDGQSIRVPVDGFPAPDREGGVLRGDTVIERAVATESPVASGYEAVASASQPPAALILGVAGANGLTLGGIPTARLTVSDLAGRSTCDIELDPYAPGCDPIVFVGLGKRGADESRWQLIDDQIKPVRGLKDQAVIELVGVAEALEAGDELALLIYGFHPQYPASWSRDALVPFVNVAGTVQVPVLQGRLEDAP